MFIFGHLGFGALIVSPFRRLRREPAVLIGTLFPDVLDKPLFYLMPNLMDGTRNLGHTMWPLWILGFFFYRRRSPWILALMIGIATHHFLDYTGDIIRLDGSIPLNLTTFCWPFLGWDFPSTPYLPAKLQANRLLQPYFMVTEFLGLAFLGGIWWKWRRSES